MALANQPIGSKQPKIPVAYLILAQSLVVIQQLKHCRGRVFVEGTEELWEQTGSHWRGWGVAEKQIIK